MNKENTQKMFDDFPELYRGHESNCMHWGFAIGDGWFQLIYQLSAAIVAHADKAGVHKYDEGFPQVTQVKEKFGGLRFSVRYYRPEEVVQMISEAEDLADRICMNCGCMDDTVMLRSNGWQFNFCLKCATEHHPEALPVKEYYERRNEFVAKKQREDD